MKQRPSPCASTGAVARARSVPPPRPRFDRREAAGQVLSETALESLQVSSPYSRPCKARNQAAKPDWRDRHRWLRAAAKG
ncbi:MAG: hypothetical protein R3F17_01015 [Planctomycetota bacterium]